MNHMSSIRRIAVVAAACVSAGVALSGEFSAECGCRAVWDETTLTVGNDLFSRTWCADGKVLRTVSFSLAGGDGSFVSSGLGTNEAVSALSVACREERHCPVSEKSLVVEATLAGRVTTIRVFPSVPGPILSFDHETSIAPAASKKDYRAYKTDGWALRADLRHEVDDLLFPRPHLRICEMRFLDQTDVRDNLMETVTLYGKTVELPRRHFCAVIDAYDPFAKAGAVFLRLGPQPSSRPGDVPDFVIDANRNPIVIMPLANGYPVAELLYRGGPCERIAALRSLQRAFRPYRSGRDGILLSNTWGGGNCDSRITEDFLMKEVAAGAELGVDVIQIDDGWQHGRTKNSMLVKAKNGVWNGYWAIDENFWKPAADRFPKGLSPLVAAAKSHGMRFGLWFAPDSSNDASNWERDADCLLDFYRSLGITYFKIDSVKLKTPLAFSRNRQMYAKMLEGSDGAMVFDLDSTAEVRPGYFGTMEFGPIFVENRYGRGSYRPWGTLASLWQLSHAIDPLRLRMEVVDPEPSRQYLDETDPLVSTKWPADCLFAISMFASPLAWMELSEISRDRMATMRAIISRWRAERDHIYSGVTFPVGSRPDGFAWTGFVNRGADGSDGYALLFRELNDDPVFSLPLGEYFPGQVPNEAEIMGGRGTVWLKKGVLKVRIDSKLDFLWVKLRRR